MPSCYENLLIPRESGNYKKYLNQLYKIFRKEVLNANLCIKGRPVRLRTYPPENLEFEESFYHLTCRNYDKKSNNRFPDFKRAERIRLIKPIIENFIKCETCLLDPNCNGILIWKEPVNGINRIHLYLQEEAYIIVLENRSTYYLLVTAFYVDYDKIEYYLKKFDKFKIDIDAV